VSADRYEVFERMHHVCFHYEFEHDPADPDEECSAGGCPSKTVHPRPMRRPENVAAVAGLARGLADRLSPQQQLWGAEYLQAHEWGLALEMFADWLSEEGSSLSRDERVVFERLSTQVGNGPRVMGPLALCPERP
jgi:hypothetical protein